METSEPRKMPGAYLSMGAVFTLAMFMMVATLGISAAVGAAAFDSDTPNWVAGAAVAASLWVGGFAVAGYFPLDPERRSRRPPFLLLVSLAVVASTVATSISGPIVPAIVLLVLAPLGGYLTRAAFSRAASMKASNKGA